MTRAREILNELPPDAVAMACFFSFVIAAMATGLDWWLCVWIVYG